MNNNVDQESSDIIGDKNIKLLGGSLLREMAIGGAAQLRANADEVNKLNVFPVPDGDTGDNMRMTIEGGVAAIENSDSDDISDVMNTLSRGMLLGARGNSGVILSQFFAGIAKGFAGVEKADAYTVGYAFELGVKQAYTSVMTPTEGTILTVAREAVEYASKRIDTQSTVTTFFADLVKEMRASLERTPEILAVLREAGVVDSGGAGLLYIMDGFNRVLNGEELDKGTSTAISAAPKAVSAPVTDFGPDSEMKYGYCTELLLQLQNKKTDIDAFDVEALKAFLAQLGDSIVAFKTESIVKIHVHTFTPDKVLAHALTFGEFISVKIENMSVQHTATLESDEKKENTPVAITKKYGVVAVSNGDGISALYKELGCDEIVEGGQTQNPSTNDFLDAFAKVPAEHIFVFPNNGNILMAAKQAAEIYTRSKVYVVASKNIGTGYAALASIDFENPDPDAILAEMNDAIKRVTAGYVAPAVRDAKINGVRIYKGDTIGIIEKEIVLAEKDRINVASKLAERLLDSPDKFMLTVFCGKEAGEKEREELNKALTERCPSAEIYFNDGGQDIYPFIFVAE